MHLLVLIFVFPAILKSDNIWRMFRVLITITILCIAYSAFQNMTDVEYYGDCNVSMLSLWVVLIYLSALRVAYVVFERARISIMSLTSLFCYLSYLTHLQ